MRSAGCAGQRGYWPEPGEWQKYESGCKPEGADDKVEFMELYSHGSKCHILYGSSSESTHLAIQRFRQKTNNKKKTFRKYENRQKLNTQLCIILLHKRP